MHAVKIGTPVWVLRQDTAGWGVEAYHVLSQDANAFALVGAGWTTRIIFVGCREVWYTLEAASEQAKRLNAGERVTSLPPPPAAPPAPTVCAACQQPLDRGRLLAQIAGLTADLEHHQEVVTDAGVEVMAWMGRALGAEEHLQRLRSAAQALLPALRDRFDGTTEQPLVDALASAMKEAP